MAGGGRNRRGTPQFGRGRLVSAVTDGQPIPYAAVGLIEAATERRADTRAPLIVVVGIAAQRFESGNPHSQRHTGPFHEERERLSGTVSARVALHLPTAGGRDQGIGFTAASIGAFAATTMPRMRHRSAFGPSSIRVSSAARSAFVASESRLSPTASRPAAATVPATSYNSPAAPCGGRRRHFGRRLT